MVSKKQKLTKTNKVTKTRRISKNVKKEKTINANDCKSLQLMTISNTRRGLRDIREAFKKHSKTSPFSLAEVIGEIVTVEKDEENADPKDKQKIGQQLVFYSNPNGRPKTIREDGTTIDHKIIERKWVNIENFAVLFMITHLRKRRLKNNSQNTN